MAQNNKLLGVLVSVLAAMFLLGGAVLIFWKQDSLAEPVPDLPAETTVTEKTTAEATSSTVSTTSAIITATTAAAETTVTETTEPPLTPEESLYAEYLTDTLILRWKRAQTFSPAQNSAQTGIAAAFVRDFRGTGTPDLLVIRLDKTLDGSAPAPVFMWYTLRDGEVVRLDEFECKMNWCEFAIRLHDGRLYLSGDYGGIDFAPQSWLFSELAVVMQNDGDLILENMQQDYISDRPAALYPDDAELLLEMQLCDTPAAYPAERQYLLLEFSDLDRLLQNVPPADS